MVPPGLNSEYVCRITSRMSKKYFDNSADRFRRRKPAECVLLSRSIRSISAHVLRGNKDLFPS